jgi:alpha-L-rhamnosidase
VSSLADDFRNPPKSYRPQPFYFLNHRLTEPELRRQIAEMDGKGVGGAVLHCRHGLLVEYLSEEWFRLIGVCIDECRKRGMEAWLYDEDDWPSGTVGGKLTREHPEFRMRYLRVQELPVTGGARVAVTLDPDDNALVAIQASRFAPVGLGLTPAGRTPVQLAEEYEDLTACYADGLFAWDAPEGQWLVLVFWECPVAAKVTYNNGYYLDTMNEEAVAAFREASYDPYDRFRADFGGTVKGVFTDEPGLMIHDAYIGTQAMRTSVDDLNRVLPGHVVAWTRDLPRKFRELKGYDIIPHLRDLLYEVSDETNKVRLDYHDALTTWYVGAYHRALSAWCEKRGLDYIGHTLEDPLWNQVRTQGNQTRVLECFHRPGLDYLCPGVGTRDSPYRILATKCASSVAHVEGRERVMCEAFGGSGHQHTMADRRLDASFMACLGVNMILPHAFYYSFEGFRKTDWPPTEFYHTPFWRWYRAFAGYIGRLSLFGATGTHVASAAVLSPALTVQTEMFMNGEPNRTPDCQQLFNEVSDLLLRLHCDYDYLDDSQLPRSEVRDGALAFASSKETYPLLVMPAVRVISLEAMEAVKRLVEGGGSVLALGELPSESTRRGEDEAVQALAGAVFGEQPGVAMQHPSGGKALYVEVAGDLPAVLPKALARLTRPDVVVTALDGSPAEDVICCHRRTDDLDLFLFVNRTWEAQGATATLLGARQTGIVEVWDLETGETRPMAHRRDDGGDTLVDLALAPCEAMLVATREGVAAEVMERPREVAWEMELPAPRSFEAVGGNVAILDRWTYVTRDLEAGRQEGIIIPGQVNTYETTFTVEGVIGRVRFIFDDLEQWVPSHVGFLARKRSTEVYLNGHRLPALKPSTWQDSHYLEADVTGLTVPGENRLRICTISLLNPMHGLTEPVYLLGEFALRDGWARPLPATVDGPWNEAGFPHFSGIGRYVFWCDLGPERLEGRAKLDCGQVHDSCRVAVNGREMGVRLWPPYQVDVAAALKAGQNEIVVEVANSLANLYAKDAGRTSGLADRPRLVGLR